MAPSEPGVGSLDAVRGPAAAPQALVVILNYNGIEDTLVCLDSLRAQTVQVAVMVIDNGSRNDDLGRISQEFPEVEVIALGENRGWAGGNNVGIRLGLERGYAQICLLNNDTVLRADAMAELLAAAAVIGAPCLLHPVVFDFADTSHPHLFPYPLAATADATARRLAEQHEVREIDWAYGACLLVSAELARRIGLLDERFFLQLEEQDYYRRARQAGMRSYCTLRARILHKESVSFGGRITPNKTYYQVRNSLLLAEKHERNLGGVLRSLRYLMWSLRHQARARRSWAASRLGFLVWLVSFEPVARGVRHGVRDYFLRRFGPRAAPRRDIPAPVTPPGTAP